MFWWREQRAVGDRVVDLAFTDNRDGFSIGSHAELNLGAHVGDDPASVERNRAALAERWGLPSTDLRFMAQVHGTDVAVLPGALPAAQPPTADAMIGSDFDQALLVLVADCTPVLLYDNDAALIAVVHAGRPGMVGGVVVNTVERMRELGAGDLRAVVGPSVCGRCYEVPEAMRAQAAQHWPAAHAVSWTGTPAIDVAAGVVSQLRSTDVPLDWIPGCTREQSRLFSHRRDHQAGRFAGVISMRRVG